MSNDNKNYDELLSAFESTPKKTNSDDNIPIKRSSSSVGKQITSKPEVSTPSTARSTSVNGNGTRRNVTPTANRVRPAPPPRTDVSPRRTAQENKAYRNGVYFSNPPQQLNRDAQMQRAAGRTGSARNVNVKEKEIKGNVFQRFIKNNGKNLIVQLIIIAVVSLILCVYGIGCINDVLALKTDDRSVEVRVEEGMSNSDVINILKKEDLIHNKFFCKVFIKFMEITDDSSRQKSYISGVYTLNPNMGVEAMLNTMKTNYKNAETVKLTFPEGWTIQEIAEKLESNEVCTASSFISTLQTVDFSNEYDFIKQIPNKEKRFRVLEGYIYPDTYEFYKGENASSVVRRFLDNFENRWTKDYQKKADKLGYTVDEIIIMASILEAEAANSKQMPKIASVLYNRLDRSGTFPLLQCDSTEDYLLDVIKPQLTSSIEDTQKYIEYRDNYDTYSENCKGLPVGPIGNPGGAAIKAALNPDDTDYYYFRHDVNGGIYYANTMAQHEENGRIAAKVKKDD